MAANRQGVKAGKAYIELLIDDSKVGSQLRSIGNKLRNAGQLIGMAGAAITAPFVGAAKIFADTGSALFDMSKRTGLSVEALSELKYAADQTGTSMEDVEKAIRAMQKQGLDAGKFDQIAAGIAAIADPTERTQAALKAFGRFGTVLLPMLGDMKKLREEARRLGLVMSAEDAAAADKLGDAMAMVRAQGTRLFQVIGSAIAGPLTQFLARISEILPKVFDWIKANKDLVKAVGVIGVALTAIGSALAFIGVVLPAVAAGFALIAASPVVLGLGAVAGAVLLIAGSMGQLNNVIDLIAPNLLLLMDFVKVWSRFAPKVLGGGVVKGFRGGGGATGHHGGPTGDGATSGPEGSGGGFSQSQFGGKLAEQRFGASKNLMATSVSIQQKMLICLETIKGQGGGLRIGTV